MEENKTMRQNVLWRKIARIILLLAERLDVAPERAMNLFYHSRVCVMLNDPRYGLHLMSDTFIVNDLIEEPRKKQKQDNG